MRICAIREGLNKKVGIFRQFQNRKRYEDMRNRTLYQWRQDAAEMVLLESVLKSYEFRCVFLER